MTAFGTAFGNEWLRRTVLRGTIRERIEAASDLRCAVQDHCKYLVSYHYKSLLRRKP
jgi:hypothetical protein